ncbi:hypothetical protein MAR_029306, partial [Mya arenaria]
RHIKEVKTLVTPHHPGMFKALTVLSTNAPTHLPHPSSVAMEVGGLQVLPPDKVIFSEHLYDKLNSKFKKIKVDLTQTCASDGGKDELKHWQVTVVQCGSLSPGQLVFLCLSKYAFSVVLNVHILHHHPFNTSPTTLTTNPDAHTLEISVQERAPNEESGNFSLTRKYVFQSPHWQSMEKSFKDLICKSQHISQKPSAHFNILHSEQSASFTPGTTSDSIMIIPHSFENNNTSSSSSNGHMPGHIPGLTPGPKGCGTNFDALPTPHLRIHAASNGSACKSDSSAVVVLENHDSEHFIARGPNLVFDVHQSASDKLDNAVKENINETVPRKANPPKDLSLKTPQQHSTKVETKRFSDSTLSPQKSISPGTNLSFSGAELLVEDFFDPHPSFLAEAEATKIPLPAPCMSLSAPHADFPDFRLRISEEISDPNDDHSDLSLHDSDVDTHLKLAGQDGGETLPKFPATPPPPRRKPLLRSQSFIKLSSEEWSHFYVNMAQELSARSSIHDDSIFQYYRFYYNLGIVRITSGRMSKKIIRRKRLSSEIPQLDFNKLENHENWYDRDYKERSKDITFCRLMNIPPESDEPPPPPPHPNAQQDDDPYWTKSTLCVTLQQILQEAQDQLAVFDEIRQALDLTPEQLMQVQTLLSLLPAHSNWRTLAEYIGLSSIDTSIIEHFCFTYRELAAKVVFAHWMRESHRPDYVSIPCCWESLATFAGQHDREDVLKVIRQTEVNPVADEDMITHLGIPIESKEAYSAIDGRHSEGHRESKGKTAIY